MNVGFVQETGLFWKFPIGGSRLLEFPMLYSFRLHSNAKENWLFDAIGMCPRTFRNGFQIIKFTEGDKCIKNEGIRVLVAIPLFET